MARSGQRADISEVSSLYEQFSASDNVQTVMSSFKHLLDTLNIQPSPSAVPSLVEQLKVGLSVYPKARRCMEELCSVAVEKGYMCSEEDNKGVKKTSENRFAVNCCAKRKVLIVGGGPSGLRTAIEARLLGARVVVIDKRSEFTRYNIVHLWHQAVADLRAFKPRIFCQDLCSGSHNTISIRQLQFFLLKTALCYGVDFYPGINYLHVVEPTGECGWRAKVSPSLPEVEEFEFDVLVDASGKRNLVYEIDTPNHAKNLETKRTVRTMIAVAASFVNSGDKSERFPQVNGVSGHLTADDNAHLNVATKLQKKGFGVESIAYYRRETHYFIFTIKKSVLKDMNLINQDYDSLKLNLEKKNINRDNLEKYVMRVANELVHMASNGSGEAPLRLNQFHADCTGENDVNIFGFEALASASNSSKIVERKDRMLFLSSVGDSLTSPFWPEGTGIIKGFMCALDTCWILKLWSLNEKRITPLQLLGTKEYLYSHLRYMDKKDACGGILKKHEGLQRIHFDRKVSNKARQGHIDSSVFHPALDPWSRYNRSSIKKNYSHMINLYDTDVDARSKYLENMALFEPDEKSYSGKNYGAAITLSWYNELLALYDLTPVVNFSSSWINGIALLAVISIWDPKLVDWLTVSDEDEKNIQRAANIIALKCGIPPPLTAKRMSRLTSKDETVMVNYLEKIMQFINSNCDYLILGNSLKSNIAWKRPAQCLPRVNTTPDNLGNTLVKRIKTRMSGNYLNPAMKPIEDENANICSYELPVPELQKEEESVAKTQMQRRLRFSTGSILKEKATNYKMASAAKRKYDALNVSKANAPTLETSQTSLRVTGSRKVAQVAMEANSITEFRGNIKRWRADENEKTDSKDVVQLLGSSPLCKEGKLEVLDDDVLTPQSLTYEHVQNIEVLRVMAKNKAFVKAIVRAVDQDPALHADVYKAVREVKEATPVSSGLQSSTDGYVTANEALDSSSDEGDALYRSICESEDVSPSEVKLRRMKSLSELYETNTRKKCRFCCKKISTDGSNTITAYDQSFHNYCLKCELCKIKLSCASTFKYDYKNDLFLCNAHEDASFFDTNNKIEDKSSYYTAKPDFSKLAHSAKKLATISKEKKFVKFKF